MGARMRRLGRNGGASGREPYAMSVDPLEKRGEIGRLLALEDVLRIEIAQSRQIGAVVVGEDQLGSINCRAARIGPAQQAHRVVASGVGLARRGMLHPGVPSIYSRAA